MISPVSGSIFERRLVEKFITENGTDPVNGKELTVEQLIDVKSKFADGISSICEISHT